MTGKHWTTDEDRLIARSTPAHTVRIAHMLGRSEHAVNLRRRALQRGTTPRQRLGDVPGPRNDWTEGELRYLDTHVGADTLAEIAQALGRTRNAVKVKAMRRGLRQRRPNPKAAHHPGFSARQVARLLGIGCSKTVVWWIREGWLVGSQTIGAGQYRRWRILGPDLEDFLRTYRWLYRSERIQDRGWRAFVTGLPREEYLTTGQAAPLLFFANSTCVTQAIYRGDLFAVKRGNNWQIPRSAMRTYEPPPLGGGATPLALRERRRRTLALMGGAPNPTRRQGKPIPLPIRDAVDMAAD